MSEPIFPSIETDASELYRIGMERIAELSPDFDTDVVASPESWLMEAVAEVASEIQIASSAVPPSIFRYYGENMLGIALIEGEPAIAEIEVLLGDTLGHTIDAETNFLLYIDGETSFEFANVDDVIVAPGGNSATFTVRCTSSTADANGSGVSGVEMVDSVPFISLVSIVDVAAGGLNGETEDEYIPRLTDTLQLLSTRPITARDFEISGRANFGGRWLCLDTYDAVLETWGNALTTTLVGIKDDGTVFSAPELALVDTFMQANRMSNFVVHVMSPVFDPVDVTFTITVADGFDASDTLGAVEAAIALYLSPETWGLPLNGDEVRWDSDDEVRYFTLVAVAMNTVGVKSLESLTLNGGTVDHALANEWTLVSNGTIAGAVV